MRILRILLGATVLLLCVTLLAQSAAAPAAPAGMPDSRQVLDYLNQSIDWYRHLSTEEQIATDPSDVLFVNDDRQIANQVVRLSFDFARADAQYAAAKNTPANAENTPQSRYQSLFQASSQTDQLVKDTQNEMDGLRQKLATARGKARKTLQSTLDELQAELQLAQARSEAIHNMLQFVNTGATGTSSNNLAAQIQELQRSVPEVAPATTAAANAPESSSTKATAAANAPSSSSSSNSAQARRQEPSGILALTTDLFSLTRKIHTIDQTLQLTGALAQNSQNLRTPLVKNLAAAVQRGNVLAQQADTSDAAGLQQERRELDALTAQFKQNSAVLLPLGKQSVLFDLYKSSLTRWRTTVKNQYTVELKNLGLRLIVLAVILAIFFIISEVWKRATFRYVHDFRRRYQFLLLRRILLWFIVAVTVAFALATEIGSLATFAGLITAGIAVALQNVILSIAGYFFLIGRYGVRVGDRVQISGVTGDVLDIGLVRIHLMEIAGTGNYMQPTGRVVVFSNSIVFQPTASFYKQIPGTNFAWHEVTLTLAPESDIHLAETRLLGAVEKVYAGYKERIEREHRAMQQSLSIQVAMPKPVSRLRLNQTGLEVVIRYPLELENAADIDDKITRAVVETLNESPRLKLVGTGTPNIQEVPEAEIPQASKIPEMATKPG
jgi:small-conductance mechanosensitive channel